MKIIVSGWPGCGSTTLSLILTKMINMKLYRGSESFRYLSKALRTGDAEEDMVFLNQVVQPEWGPVYDKYISAIFSNETINGVVDSDITGFLIGKRPDTLSIFLHSNREVREAHLIGDNRGKDANDLTNIDDELNEKYNGYLNFEGEPINFQDLDFVQRNYSFVLDNSELPLDQELEVVINKLKEMGLIDEEQCRELMKSTAFELQLLKELGKDGYLKDLREKGLVVTAEEIIIEVRNQFPKEVAAFTDRLRDEVMKVQ